MGRAKFEYGRDPGERGLPFSREQFPLDLGHVLTYNKGQGQTYQRTGLWNFNAQPFADGMFYTGCSRSTSAAGLKIYGFLGANTDMALNKVDFELLGVRPRIADTPTVPPEHPPADPAPLLTSRRSPRVEPMDLKSPWISGSHRSPDCGLGDGLGRRCPSTARSAGSRPQCNGAGDEWERVPRPAASPGHIRS
jgi:hypothetical protein